MTAINSKDYWDRRFETDWEANRGRTQSRFFSSLALSMMPDWLKWNLTSTRASILDWGCALGDGTELLAQSLPGAQVTGCDFSEEAIRRAAETYPVNRFVCRDLTTSDSTQESWDFVFSSNTLEHFHEPWKVLDTLAKAASRGVLLLLPYEEINRIDEHHYTFLPENVPLVIADRFHLAYWRALDVSDMHATEWTGAQIFLAYVDRDDPMYRGMRLEHAVGGRAAAVGQASVEQLHAQLAHAKEQEALARTHAAEFEQRARFEQSEALARIAERDSLAEKITSLESALRDERAAAAAQQASVEETLRQQAEQFAAERGALESKLRAQSDAAANAIAEKAALLEKLRRLRGLRNHELTQSYMRFIHVAEGFQAAAESIMSKNRKLSADLAQVAASNSWRITAPLRKTVASLKGVNSEVLCVPELALEADESRIEDLSTRLASLRSSSLGLVQVGGGTRTIYIFTGVPFDDIGGGQRAAQLARVLLARGEQVTYVYAYRKWENGQPVESGYQAEGMRHLFLDRTSMDDVLGGATAADVALFELPHPAFLPYFSRLGELGVRRVFELIDAWDSSLGGDWFDASVMQAYVDQSEVVVGTAKILQHKLIEMGRPDARYLPNAVNESIFDSYREYPRPSEYVHGQRALLYFGSLYGEWFDWECVNAAARSCKDAAIYLIGDPPANREVEPNVRFLGGRQIEELPKYLQHCDIALLPFRPGHISDAVSPIKIFEYLAMGVPVVANELPEIAGYPNVHVARSTDDFARLCSDPLVADPTKVDDFLIENCWAGRLDQMVPALSYGRVVTVVILIHNNVDIIERCLKSFSAHASAYVKEVIVVDNASSDGGPELVREKFPDVKLIINDKNGCSSGRNLGAAAASGEYLAFFDSDQWITGRGAFEEALSILERNPAVGAVGWAAGWFADGSDTFGGPIVDYLPRRGTTAPEYQALGYRTDIAYLGSGGLFVSKEVFDQAGGFDEFYDPTCFEDTDFSLAIKGQGYLLAYRDLQSIRHQAHQTTSASQDNAAYQVLFKRNSAHFGEKWSGRPDFFFDAPP
ncbi:glycosyltransferase [Lysobacter auxotrophicus]|uniref:Glycosyltransferase n=1 Tax=Lysobacter auxotrophicus TaxID=2992573 RepID=A0ABN6UGR5_9GAMM|nr:glycosyltransferase [Lysobacter auxotrophicus]BDU15468.1 glycosyltransferase [Lysobacter auxotrophicus]